MHPIFLAQMECRSKNVFDGQQSKPCPNRHTQPAEHSLTAICWLLRYSIRRRRLETQTSAMFGRNQFRLYDEVFMRFTPANSYISAHCCCLPGPVAMLLLRSNELVRSEKGLPPLCGAPAARRAAPPWISDNNNNIICWHENHCFQHLPNVDGMVFTIKIPQSFFSSLLLKDTLVESSKQKSHL